MEMRGQKMALPNEMQKNNWVIFHKDRKHETMEEGKSHFEKWKLNQKKEY